MNLKKEKSNLNVCGETEGKMEMQEGRREFLKAAAMAAARSDGS